MARIEIATVSYSDIKPVVFVVIFKSTDAQHAYVRGTFAGSKNGQLASDCGINHLQQIHMELWIRNEVRLHLT